MEKEKTTLLQELDDIKKRCSKRNWIESEPVSEGTLKHARDFILWLQKNSMHPEISAEPDGEIAFDWFEKEGMFSISISGMKRFAYADTRPTFHNNGYINHEDLYTEIKKRNLS